MEVSGPITLDDQDLMIDAALQGCGLAYVAQGRAQRHIASGALLQCLNEWCSDEDLFLYYPSRRYVSAGLRADRATQSLTKQTPRVYWSHYESQHLHPTEPEVARNGARWRR